MIDDGWYLLGAPLSKLCVKQFIYVNSWISL